MGLRRSGGLALGTVVCVVEDAPSAVHSVLLRHVVAQVLPNPALETTQGQMDGFSYHLPYKCHLEEVVSVGD